MIIEGLKEYFAACPIFDGKNVNVDILDRTPMSVSIKTLECVPIIKRYADGGSMKQYCFILTFRGKSTPNGENAKLCERLARWLEEKNENGDFPEIGDGKTVQKIEVTRNGKMTGDNMHSTEYEMRCRLVYTEA